MPTVLPFHRAVVADPAFTSEPFSVHTRWIEAEFAGNIPPYPGLAALGDDAEQRERITVEVGGKRLEVTVPAGFGGGSAGGTEARGARARGGSSGAAPAARTRGGGRRGGTAAGGHNGDELVSPMQGTIVKIVAADGEQVAVGDTIVVLEAMKMEQPLTAHKAGTVTGLSISVGQTVPAGAVICQLR